MTKKKESELLYMHPAVSMLFFVSVIGFSMFITDPLFIVISLSGAIVSALTVCGLTELMRGMKFVLPICLFAVILNPLFNHRGATVLFYLKSGNPFTFESVVFGAAVSVMLLSVFTWFMSMNTVMTTDKIVYLFGRIFPSFSLVISMSLRFVPRFSNKFKETANMQKCIGKGIVSGNLIIRLRHFVRILSIMITWSLESSIETSDSMKARGYGLPGRSAYSLFIFEFRDAVLTFICLILSATVVIGRVYLNSSFYYFPAISYADISIGHIFICTFYGILCFLPVLAEITKLKMKLAN